MAAAQACGVDRAGGEGQLSDELLGQVAERVRPHRSDGHGQAWELLTANHALLERWLKTDGLTAVKAHELLARQGHRGARRSAYHVHDDDIDIHIDDACASVHRRRSG